MSTTGYIAVLQDNKKFQTLKQTRGANEVHAISVSLIDETGAAYGVKHVDNKPRVSSIPYAYDIAEGNVANHEYVGVFGHNDTVAAAFETVSDISTLMPYLSAAEDLSIVSSSVEDDTGGTGAITMVVTGLDANYDAQTTTVTLDGQTPVNTGDTYLRIHDSYVATAGSNGTNVGTISIQNNAATSSFTIIQPNEGQSHSANYTVPDGYTLYIANGWFTESSSKGSEMHVFVRPLNAAWRSVKVFNIFDNGMNLPLPFPFSVAAKTDVEIRAYAVLAGANVTAGFEGWIEV